MFFFFAHENKLVHYTQIAKMVAKYWTKVIKKVNVLIKVLKRDEYPSYRIFFLILSYFFYKKLEKKVLRVLKGIF